MRSPLKLNMRKNMSKECRSSWNSSKCTLIRLYYCYISMSECGINEIFGTGTRQSRICSCWSYNGEECPFNWSSSKAYKLVTILGSDCSSRNRRRGPLAIPFALRSPFQRRTDRLILESISNHEPLALWFSMCLFSKALVWLHGFKKASRPIICIEMISAR